MNKTLERGVQGRILHTQHQMATPVGAAIISETLLQDGFAAPDCIPRNHRYGKQAASFAVAGFQCKNNIFYSLFPLEIAKIIITVVSLIRYCYVCDIGLHFDRFSYGQNVPFDHFLFDSRYLLCLSDIKKGYQVSHIRRLRR